MKEALAKFASKPIYWDCPLSSYTSFGIGGPAAALIRVADSRELQAIITFLTGNDVQWQVIGRGTNLLVSDSGYNGAVLLLGEGFKRVTFQGHQDKGIMVRAGGACSLTRLSGLCIRKGCSGLEFACGIPGSIGGGVIMNAGAWGKKLSDVLSAVEIMTTAGSRKLPRQEMSFSYRRWVDRPGDCKQVVTEAELLLQRDDPEKIRKRCVELLRKRREKQPKGLPNAGSFFKNPEGESAGRLIEKSGCKEMRVGGAMVSPVHANFLVNTGGATAADIRKLMDIVQEKVQKESGVFLEPEVHFL